MPYPNATKVIALNVPGRRWFARFALALVLAAPQALAAEACGLLWRIESEGGAASHVFGTIHSEDPRVVDLPEPVSKEFREADVYAMEMIPDFQVMADLVKAMHFQDQRNLREVLGVNLFRRATEALSGHGIGEGLALKMKPWAVAVTLSFPRPETGLFLDIMLFNRAMADGKKTVGLEKAEEQLSFFTRLSMEEQVQLLEVTLEQSGEIEQTMDQLVRAWLSRNPDTLSALSDSYLEELPGDLAQRFREQAIDQRNRRMFERMQPLVQEGDAFIAVGALHLYGEEGLLELLRINGYDVECVY